MINKDKKTIKIGFCDFWHGFNYKNQNFFNILKENYNPILSDEPDYLFCSCFGSEHFKYKDCIKIFYTGENIVCDFNIYDYGLTSHYMTITDRHLRFPQWLPSDINQVNLMEFGREKNPDLHNKKFCNFIYSNSQNSEKAREIFFTKLSKYKKIDSGGGILNNLGYVVKNKLDFIKDYKFTIAIENSFIEGYTTEKLSDPFIAGSMPLYYGDPLVGKEFNTGSFVNLRDFKSFDEAVDYIIELDKNDKLYIEKFNQSCFVNNNVEKYYKDKLNAFFDNIFNREKSEAKRTTQCGRVGYLTDLLPPPPMKNKKSIWKKIRKKMKRIFLKENI